MTDRLTPREFVLARMRLAEVISGQAGKSSYSDREAAERVLQSGFVNLDALLPKPTQGEAEKPSRAEARARAAELKAEAEQARLRETLKRVHDHTQGEKPYEGGDEQLEADVGTMIFEGGRLYRGPIGTPLDGIVGPRTKLTMRVATLPLETVEALERILQAYTHVLDSGPEQSWYGTRRGKEAVFQDIESNWRAARIDEVPENVARKLATAGGNVLVALIAQERLAKTE